MTVKEKNTTWFFYGRFALNLLVIKVPKPISDLAYYQVLDNFFFSFFPWKQPWKYFFFLFKFLFIRTKSKSFPLLRDSCFTKFTAQVCCPYVGIQCHLKHTWFQLRLLESDSKA